MQEANRTFQLKVSSQHKVISWINRIIFESKMFNSTISLLNSDHYKVTHEQMHTERIDILSCINNIPSELCRSIDICGKSSYGIGLLITCSLCLYDSHLIQVTKIIWDYFYFPRRCTEASYQNLLLSAQRLWKKRCARLLKCKDPWVFSQKSRITRPLVLKSLWTSYLIIHVYTDLYTNS